MPDIARPMGQSKGSRGPRCMVIEPWSGHGRFTSVHWVAVMNHDMKDMKGDGHPMVKGGIYMDLYGFIK